jgi:hypothetical protein
MPIPEPDVPAPVPIPTAVPLAGRASADELHALWIRQPGSHVANFNAAKGSGTRPMPMSAVNCMQIIHAFTQKFPSIPPGFTGYGRSVGIKELLMVTADIGDEAAGRYIYDAYIGYHNNSTFCQIVSVYKGLVVKDLRFAWNNPNSEIKKHDFVDVARYAKHIIKNSAEPLGAK